MAREFRYFKTQDPRATHMRSWKIENQLGDKTVFVWKTERPREWVVTDGQWNAYCDATGKWSFPRHMSAYTFAEKIVAAQRGGLGGLGDVVRDVFASEENRRLIPINILALGIYLSRKG